jgi:hypothetical protein
MRNSTLPPSHYSFAAEIVRYRGETGNDWIGGGSWAAWPSLRGDTNEEVNEMWMDWKRRLGAIALVASRRQPG